VSDTFFNLRAPWRSEAACRGLSVELFFPGPGEGNGRVNETHYFVGKTVCARCPVRRECLDYAGEHAILDGLWGGLTPRERWGGRPG
jgi:WhiB family redox-sensing transcriptional regulator